MLLRIWTHQLFTSVPSIILRYECLIFVQVVVEHLNIWPWLGGINSVETALVYSSCELAQ